MFKTRLSHLFWLLICFVILTAPCIATPPYLMTERVYNSTKRALDLHINQTRALPLFVPGLEPRFYLHAPGESVYGTVVIYHGYGLNAALSDVQARYLFSQGFNTVAFNLPGFSQAPSEWPGTVLRESYGYEAVRRRLLNSTFIQDFLATRGDPERTGAFVLRYGPDLVGRPKRVLAGDRFRRAREAIDALGLNVDFNALSSNILDRYESQHTRYDAEPYAQLALVSELPGPRYAVGFSLGGAAVTNLAGRSRAFSGIVLLAPFFAKFSAPSTRAYVELTGFVDTLNVYDRPVSTEGTAPGSTMATAGIHALMASRDEITAAVRETTRTMCVIAEDDDSVEVQPALEICRSKMAAQKIFVYPRPLGVGHAITPDTGNRFGISLMDQIARFFRGQQINDADFLVAKNFTS